MMQTCSPLSSEAGLSLSSPAQCYPVQSLPRRSCRCCVTRTKEKHLEKEVFTLSFTGLQSSFCFPFYVSLFHSLAFLTIPIRKDVLVLCLPSWLQIVFCKSKDCWMEPWSWKTVFFDMTWRKSIKGKGRKKKQGERRREGTRCNWEEMFS